MLKTLISPESQYESPEKDEVQIVQVRKPGRARQHQQRQRARQNPKKNIIRVDSIYEQPFSPLETIDLTSAKERISSDGRSFVFLDDSIKEDISKPVPSTIDYPDFWSYFSKEAILGEGGYGQVFKVRELNGGRLFALKILQSKPDESQLQEIELLRRLSAHPSCSEFVVCFYNVLSIPQELGSNQVKTALLTEYIEGSDLYHLTLAYLNRNIYIPAEQIREILSGVLKGLVYVHSKGIIHGDVKLENVMYRNPDINSAGYKPVLIDFGLGCFQPCQEPSHRITPAFWSPEAATYSNQTYRKLKVDQIDWVKAEMWSFGCLAYDLITLDRCDWIYLAGNDWELDRFKLQFHIAKMNRSLADLSGLPNQTEANIYRLILACFKMDPNQRPTADQALRILM